MGNEQAWDRRLPAGPWQSPRLPRPKFPRPKIARNKMPHPTKGLFEALTTRQTPIAIIGLGYVGLPLAVCLAKIFNVIGFDINRPRINQLLLNRDDTGELDSAAIAASGMTFTTDPTALRQCGVIIVAVPTPVDQAKRPDFTALISASTTVGQNLRPGAVVVFESTVYPGATEEICIPIIEKESGTKAGVDFTYGYSPERINPGDKEHTIDKVRKVVSGSDVATLDLVAGLYGAAIPAGVFRASSIRVAEAAKVIENTQRDLNIALVNELALIFHRLGLDTLEVLEAAGTKWNFLPFRPGLVGGHCIGVDPYYLTHKAAEVGYYPEVILAGRRINDGMGRFVAQECVRLLLAAERPVKGALIVILGLSFKENCADLRNSRVADIISELRRFGARPIACDPLADAQQARSEFGIELVDLAKLPSCSAIIAAVPHQAFKETPCTTFVKAAGIGAPFLDVKSAWSVSQLDKSGLLAWRL